MSSLIGIIRIKDIEIVLLNESPLYALRLGFFSDDVFLIFHVLSHALFLVGLALFLERSL